MQPWLFPALGITPQGAGFEAVLLLLVLGAGAALLAREWPRRQDAAANWMQWAVGGALAGAAALQLIRLAATGALLFGERGFQLPTYGVLIAGGAAIAIWMSYRDAARTPGIIDPVALLDLYFWLVVGSMVGARGLYVLTEFTLFQQMCLDPAAAGLARADCLAAFRFWEGGLVFWGGVVAAQVVGIVWCRRVGVSYLRATDVVVPYLPLGHAIGRLGCHAAGCCFGNDCAQPWAVEWPADSIPFRHLVANADAAQSAWLTSHGTTPGLHPVQLYEAFGEFALFLVLILVVRRRRTFDGQIFAAWLIGYSVLRFVLEPSRGDIRRGFLFEAPLTTLNNWVGLPADAVTVLSTSQAISIGGLLVGIALLVGMRGRTQVLSDALPKPGAPQDG